MESVAQSFMQILVCIKLLHWQTLSYAKHIASDSLHEKMSKNIDKFMEIYQAKANRRIEFKPLPVHIFLKNFDARNDSQFLKEVQDWLEKQLVRFINQNDTVLLNIRDEMLGDVRQTIYLFSFS